MLLMTWILLDCSPMMGTLRPPYSGGGLVRLVPSVTGIISVTIHSCDFKSLKRAMLGSTIEDTFEPT